jgi:hypothetical protein
MFAEMVGCVVDEREGFITGENFYYVDESLAALEVTKASTTSGDDAYTDGRPRWQTAKTYSSG